MDFRKQFYFSFLLLLCFFISCKAPKEQIVGNTEHWAGLQIILDEIQAPIFKDQNYDIIEFGAKNDSITDCLPAILKAIEKCNFEGGGKVNIPKGHYIVNGPIHLKSNVNLHLEKGATLHFSTNPQDYLPVVLTRWESTECYNYSPLIYANNQENIGLTGQGILDGHANNENWWNWVTKAEYGWKPGMPSQDDPESRPRLFDWNTRQVPVSERILGESAHMRPNFVQPYNCKNIIIDSVTIKNSPMWVINPVLSENITVSNVKVISHGPNSDGCDPESCKNVLIKNCFFDTGDDCIALKSGRNQDGRRIARPIENVVIQDCTMKDGHGGVVIGSEVSGGAKNIYAENCKMSSPNLERALRIKTNKLRGGKIENIFFRNIEVGEVSESIVRVNMRYTITADSSEVFIPEVENIYIENVTSEKSKYGIYIDGYSDEYPVKNLNITNCKFENAEKGDKIKFAENIHFKDYYLNGVLKSNSNEK